MAERARGWLLLGLFLGCGGSSASSGPTVKVTRGELIFASSFYGEIEAAETHPIFAPEFRNTWQVTVASVLPDGAAVKKGDTVLSFAKGSFEADLKERDSDLLVAAASLRKVAEQNEDERINRTLAVKRSEMAVELAKLNVVEGVNLISRLELEKAKVELGRAELQLELDKKELVTFERKRAAAMEVERLKVATATDKVDETRGQLDQMEVKAPADGALFAPYTRLNWVMSKVAPGKVVRPGDKLLEIPELDRFKASVYVRQRDATQVRLGDTATVFATMFPDQGLQGKVIAKDDFATTRNERTGSSGPQGSLKELRVVLELEKSELALRPGGTVRADIATVLVKQALMAPLAALKETRGGYTALLSNGKQVSVRVGQTSLTHAEIVQGLSEGDTLRLE